MSAKIILVFCAQALFIQLALSACAGPSNLGAALATYGLATPATPGLGTSGCAGPVLTTPVLPGPVCPGLGYNGIGYGNAGVGCGSGLGYGSNLAIEVIPTSGGAFPVSCTSSISPTGLSIVSENVFEGTLFVCGELPFASTAALDSVLPSGGVGVASSSFGNGITAIESITPSAAAYGAGSVAYGAEIGACGAGIGAYGPAAGMAPLSLLPGAGCNAPAAEFIAPINGCYPTGIY